MNGYVSDVLQQAQHMAERMDFLSQKLALVSPVKILELLQPDISARLKIASQAEQQILGKMVALQEELDWYVYHLYGLTDEALCYNAELPVVELGQRAFEILLAQNLESGESETVWFEHHGSQPNTQIPRYWASDYQNLIRRRIKEISNNRWLKLIDNKDHKRRWNRVGWKARLYVATQQWLLKRIENVGKAAKLQTCAQLADRLRHDESFQQVAAIYGGASDVDLQTLVAELVAGDSVPQMAAVRLKPAAMPKFRAWQETWNKQRVEDAIDAKFGVNQPLADADAKIPEKKNAYQLALKQAEAEKQQQVGEISVPPQYKQPDFRKPGYWSLRGKLDVPKERFFSLPGCEKAGDSTLVIGWAGLSHLQRATAIAAWYLDRKDNEGWEAEQLMPMLVALDELIPWLKQWHNHIDPEFNERMGDYYESFLLEELRTLSVPRTALTSWLPPAVASKRGGGRKKKTAAEA
ncbi:probable DNA methylase [Marinobacter sp. ELB17]|nr:probable DNA methylase [Marinobacter sp. ELB17]